MVNGPPAFPPWKAGGVHRVHDREAHAAAGLEHARALPNGCVQVVDVLEGHERDHEVERAVSEREPRRRGEVHLERRVGGARRRDHGRRRVDADDRMSAGREVACDPALPAPQIEGAPARRREISKNTSRWKRR